MLPRKTEGNAKMNPKCLQSNRQSLTVCKSEACLWFTKCTVNWWFKQPSCTTSAAILGASATPQRGCKAAMSFDMLASSHRDKTCWHLKMSGCFYKETINIYKPCWLFSVACSFVGSAVPVTLVCVQVQFTIGSSWKEICIRQECRGVLH